MIAPKAVIPKGAVTTRPRVSAAAVAANPRAQAVGKTARAVVASHPPPAVTDTVRWALALALGLALPLAATAVDKVYKTIGPDGQVIYSQTPPAQVPGQVEKQMEFRNLPATALPDYVLKFRAEMERNMAQKASQAAAPPGNGLQFFTAKWCGYCKQAQAWLNANGVAYQALDIDTPQGMTAFVRTGHKVAVPLLVGPNVKLQGFSAQAYAAALQPKQR